MRYIYSFQEGGPKEVDFVLDVIGYILFFVISVILIEVGVAANKY